MELKTVLQTVSLPLHYILSIDIRKEMRYRGRQGWKKKGREEKSKSDEKEESERQEKK